MLSDMHEVIFQFRLRHVAYNMLFSLPFSFYEINVPAIGVVFQMPLQTILNVVYCYVQEILAANVEY